MGASIAAPALAIKDLQAWYGGSHVMPGVVMLVQPGEVVTLLGSNGAGRTTAMRAILGLTGARNGSIKVNAVEAIAETVSPRAYGSRYVERWRASIVTISMRMLGESGGNSYAVTISPNFSLTPTIAVTGKS